MTTNATTIPKPTPEDRATPLDALYANTPLESVRSLIRLLAAERKQNAERGELLKDVERYALIAIGVCDPDILVCQWCEAEAADGKRESIKHDPDCLVERARRAGVEV